MKRRGKTVRLAILLVLTVGVLAILSNLLLALQQEGEKSLLLSFLVGEEGAVAGEKDTAAGGNGSAGGAAGEGENGQAAGSYEAELDRLIYFTVKVAAAEAGGAPYYAGFSSSENALSAWLEAALAAGRQGEVVEITFPAQRLKRSGPAPVYISELMLTCNRQLRHLSRAADFCGNSWEEIGGQNTTWRRLDLLLEEGSECRRQLVGLGAYYSVVAEMPEYLVLDEAWTQWLARLTVLGEDRDGRAFWLAQQQALAIVQAWQDLLQATGFTST